MAYSSSLNKSIKIEKSSKKRKFCGKKKQCEYSERIELGKDLIDEEFDIYHILYSLDMLKASISVLLSQQSHSDSIISQIKEVRNFSKTIWLEN